MLTVIDRGIKESVFPDVDAEQDARALMILVGGLVFDEPAEKHI